MDHQKDHRILNQSDYPINNQSDHQSNRQSYNQSTRHYDHQSNRQSDYHWLQELHEKHYVMLSRLTAKRLRESVGHTADLEDVLQEVFLLAFENDIRRHPNPAGWLIKATINVCWNATKSNMKSIEKQRRFVQSKMEQSADQTLFFVTSKRDETAMVELLMFLEQTLTEDEWALLKAYFLDGIPLEELAAQMGITPNNLRVKIHRLRQKVKKADADV